MEHREAVRLQAAEKYLLGELSEALRDEYEAHYFDCLECAQEVTAGATFIAASREIFLTDGAREAHTRAEVSVPSLWLAWLRPAYAVAVFAVLLVFIGYQNLVTIPAAKRYSPAAAVQDFRAIFSPRGAADEPRSPVQIHAAQPFSLTFDFATPDRYADYVGQLEDESGNFLYQFPISGGFVQRSISVAIPGVIAHPGKYKLFVAGDPSGKGQFAKANTIGYITFTVEILP